MNMKLLAFVAASALILFCASPLGAQQTPALEQGLEIYDGAVFLEGTFAIPFVVDWNNDNKKDLLVGEYGPAYVRLYLNQGTDQSPVFNGGTPIESGGVPIEVTYG